MARDLEGDEARQQAHYDEIGEAYEAHYSDEWSTLYRRRFLYEPLLKGIQQLHAAQAVESQVLRQAEIVPAASLLIARHTFPGDPGNQGQQPIFTRG